MITAEWIGSDKLLASVVRGEIEASGRTQREICAEVGITEKHLSTFLNGHNGMMLDLVDAVLGACGRVLVLSTLVMPARTAGPDTRTPRGYDYDTEGLGGT